jgi:hypothetical protein
MVMTRAGEAGSLECLKYAHENGCVLDHYVAEAAALGGNIQCLRHGIPCILFHPLILPHPNKCLEYLFLTSFDSPLFFNIFT